MNFFMSGTNVYNWQSVEKQGMLPEDFVAEKKKGYPLMDELTKETIIDDALNIVVIGDSFVWGSSSLNKNELFWRVLENDLRKDGIRANVIAVAATGANAYEELSWLTDYSLVEDLDPDIIIFGYVYNDPDDSVPINPTVVDWDKTFPLLSKMSKLLPNISTYIQNSIATKTMYTDKYTDNDFLPVDGTPIVLKGEAYQKYKTQFAEKLDAFAATVDVPVAVVTLPTLPDNDMLKALYEPLENLYAGCENVLYYNSVEDFDKFASPEHKANYSVNAVDFHPGSATNKFYADYIRAFIENDFPGLTESHEGYTPTDDIIVNDYLPYGILPEKVHEDASEAEYRILYPDTSESYVIHDIEVYPYYLISPLGKEHVKLSFADSIDINEIVTAGDYESIELYYTCIDSRLGYDDHSIFAFEKTSENTYSADADEKITSIIISAVFDEDADRNIDIRFMKNGGNS